MLTVIFLGCLILLIILFICKLSGNIAAISRITRLVLSEQCVAAKLLRQQFSGNIAAISFAYGNDRTAVLPQCIAWKKSLQQFVAAKLLRQQYSGNFAAISFACENRYSSNIAAMCCQNVDAIMTERVSRKSIFQLVNI